MRIVCPTCDAEYEVQDHLLPPGRATRCARCGHRWAPVSKDVATPSPSPEPPPLAIFPVPAGPTAMDRLSAASARPTGWLGLRLAWIGSILLLIALVAGLYAERTLVTTMWPPSLRLFAAFGLAPAAETPHRAPEAKHEGAEHGDETRQRPADRGH